MLCYLSSLRDTFFHLHRNIWSALRPATDVKLGNSTVTMWVAYVQLSGTIAQLFLIPSQLMRVCLQDLFSDVCLWQGLYVAYS